MSLIRRLLFFASFLILAASLPAQERGSVEVPRIERQTVADEDGLLQWAEFQPPACPRCKGIKVVKCPHCDGLERAEKCIECNMTKQAPCPACAGTGSPPDPLETMPCPMCYGEGCLPCDRCLNEGSIPMGEGGRTQKCPCCKGEGGYECEVCKGKRQVDAVKVRPNIGEADLENLREAKSQLEEVMGLLKAFRAAGDPRADVKEYGAAIKPVVRMLPSFKKCESSLPDLLKRLSKLDGYTGAEQAKAQAVNRTVLYNKVVLSMELQLLDLCIARQEQNEKLLAEKENKDE